LLLEQLEYYKVRHNINQRYQLWQEDSKRKIIMDDGMVLQKLDYIHNNPVKGGYVDDPLHRRCSRARNYAKQPGLLEVCTDW